MPSLKDLRTRIRSVKSTQKITSAMKMVAASKLRRSRENVEGVRPYAESMEKMVGNIVLYKSEAEASPLLLTGNPASSDHMVLVFTSDRGLCGGFNSTIIREVKKLIAQLESSGHNVHLWCVGKKGRDLLKREFGDRIFETMIDVAKRGLTYDQGEELANRLIRYLEDGKIGAVTAVYSNFRSALVQQVTHKQLIPFPEFRIPEHPQYLHTLEPSIDTLMQQVLPANLATQILRIMLESDASENGARTTAMDNATRNAKEVIDKLQIKYNRTRQAMITKELIEIISGAESVK
jgi:F-type H+-transporting ATPase subunit gamma